MAAPGSRWISEIEALDCEITDLREHKAEICRWPGLQAWLARRSIDRQIARLETQRAELESRLEEELEWFEQRRANLGFKQPRDWSELRTWEHWFAARERKERLKEASQRGWEEREREYGRQFVERYREMLEEKE